MHIRESQYVWAEKYRPATVEECILPDTVKGPLLGLVSQGKFPNMVFAGGPGTGKTTVAKALCEQTGHEWIIINGSKDSGIDKLRTEVQDFASSVSLFADRKCVVYDEGDYLNRVSTQPALRGFMEEFSGNSSFIFSLNYKHNLLKEIYSRCAFVDFTIPENEKNKIAAGIYKRAIEILENEKVKFDDKVMRQAVGKFYPDFRRLLNELQFYAAEKGEINTGFLSKTTTSSKSYDEVTDILRERSFEKLHHWTMTCDFDPGVYNDLFDFWHKSKRMKANKLPEAVLLISDYEDRATRGVNPRINLLACLTQVMTACEFV